MKTAKEFKDHLYRCIKCNCVPHKIDDLYLCMIDQKDDHLCFILTQDESVPDNCAPHDNIAIQFTETKRGFSAQFLLRSDLSPYSRSLPAEEDCDLWEWDEDIESFIRPFFKADGYNNLSEIMRTIGVF